MMNRWFPRLLAVALGASALQASAFTTSASIANVHYQLFDLDPNDGVAPSVSFAIASGGTNYQVMSVAFAQVDDEHYSLLEAPAGTALSAVASNPGNNFASAETLPGNTQTFEGGGGAVMAFGNAYAYASANVFVSNFTLSSNTLLVLSAYSSGVSVATGGPSEYVSAATEVVLEGIGQRSDAISQVEMIPGSVGGASQAPLWLTASFTNLSAGSVSGFAAVRAVVLGSGPVAAIPEPAAVHLLALGLLGVALSARRKGRARRG